jgi:hypothetical protein
MCHSLGWLPPCALWMSCSVPASTHWLPKMSASVRDGRGQYGPQGDGRLDGGTLPVAVQDGVGGIQVPRSPRPPPAHLGPGSAYGEAPGDAGAGDTGRSLGNRSCPGDSELSRGEGSGAWGPTPRIPGWRPPPVSPHRLSKDSRGSACQGALGTRQGRTRGEPGVLLPWPCLAVPAARPPGCRRESRALPPPGGVGRVGGSMSVGPLSPGTRRRLLQGQAGSLPEPPSCNVAVFISSAVSGKDRAKSQPGQVRGTGTMASSGDPYGAR